MAASIRTIELSRAPTHQPLTIRAPRLLGRVAFGLLLVGLVAMAGVSAVAVLRDHVAPVLWETIGILSNPAIISPAGTLLH